MECLNNLCAGANNRFSNFEYGICGCSLVAFGNSTVCSMDCNLLDRKNGDLRKTVDVINFETAELALRIPSNIGLIHRRIFRSKEC